MTNWSAVAQVFNINNIAPAVYMLLVLNHDLCLIANGILIFLSLYHPWGTCNSSSLKKVRPIWSSCLGSYT